MNKLYTNTFKWLAIGLLVTFITGFALSFSPNILIAILNNPLGILLPIVVQFGVCIALGFFIGKMNYQTALILFLAYSLVTGVDIAVLLLVFELSSVIFIFLAVALIFVVLAFIGKFLNINVNKFGVILLVSLLVTILLSVINIIFIHSANFSVLITAIGVVIFMGYIIYDLKIVEPLASRYGEDKASIYCAFQLYLDFINLFIRLLELFGNRRDN